MYAKTKNRSAASQHYKTTLSEHLILDILDIVFFTTNKKLKRVKQLFVDTHVLESHH
jgi:hypothetical protein